MGTRPLRYPNMRPGDPGYDVHEFFADEFAMALLMPPDEFTRLQAKGAQISTLAAHFGVHASMAERWAQRLREHPHEPGG